MIFLRQFSRSKLLLGILAAAVCGIVVLVCMYKLLPYNFEHFRRIHAVDLASMVLGWQKQGALEEDLARLQQTNAVTRFWIVKTNVVVGGKVYETVLAGGATTLGDEGYFLCTTNGEVIWVGRDGAVKLYYQAGKQK
jgi:hypothetical protein